MAVSNQFNTLRNHMPIDRFASNDTNDGEASESHINDTREAESRRSRLAPDSGIGWVILIGLSVLTLAAISYVWPLLPPSVKTLEAALVFTMAVGFPIAYLSGLNTGIKYWEQWATVHLFKGNTVTTKVGRVSDSDGNDPLFEELVSPGFAGLNPRFRTVDDEFSNDGALMSKVDRQTSDGGFGPARGRLDHAYTGDGDVEYLGDQYVVHTSGVRETEYAPGHEWTTEPPLKPDMDAARKLRDRDEKMRSHVLPSYQEQMQTLRNRLEKLKNTRQDEPMLAMNEIPEFLENIGFYHIMNQNTNGKANGNGNGLAPEPDTDIDDRADDRMAEADE